MFFDIEYATRQFPVILKAAPMTLLIATVAMLVGMAIGFSLTLCRMYKVPILNRLAILYISFIRGTPILVQIYVTFFGIQFHFQLVTQAIGWNASLGSIPSLLYAFAAFSINAGAFLSETIRSALSSVEAGQMEAAYSVGLSTVQAMRRIVIPQALVSALPNLGNAFLLLIKGSSLAFTVMVVEILSAAKIEAGAGYRYTENFVVASIIYWGMCFVFEKVFVLLENRLKRYKHEITL